MKNKNYDDLDTEEAVVILVFAVVLMLICTGINWLFTCGIVKLITMCFGVDFSWKIATGIWLIARFIYSFLRMITRRK